MTCPQPPISVKCLVVAISLPALAAHAGADSRSWTVEDNLRIEWLQTRAQSGEFVYSPDRRLVAFVVLHSDVESRRFTAQLQIFATDELRRFAAGQRSTPPALFSKLQPAPDTGPASDLLRSLMWAPDSSALFYVLREASGYRLLVWTLATGSERVIASFDSSITILRSIGPDSIAAAVVRQSADLSGGAQQLEPVVGTGRGLPELLFGEDFRWPTSRPNRLAIIRWRGAYTVRNYDVAMIPGVGVSFSPDLQAMAFEEPFSAEWSLRGWRPSQSPESGYQISVLDLRSGMVIRPFNAPTPALQLSAAPFTDDPLIAWSPDGDGAVAAMTFTKSDALPAGETDAAARPPGVYFFSRDGRTVELITRFQPDADGQMARFPTGVAWSADAKKVAVTLAPPPVTIVRTPLEDRTPRTHVYQRGDGGWLEIPLREWKSGDVDTRKPSSDLEVRQGLNDPPAIFAVSPTGSARMLRDLAPHARGRTFGRVEPISWHDQDGNAWEGILALPVNYRADARYPLLVQTHGYEKGGFLAEGPARTAFPGRAALDRGFVVLTMNDVGVFAKVERAAEPRIVLQGYRSLIRTLAGRGMVDPRKVGAIGWSRSSYYVKYALTHDPELFRAAVCADGVDYSYLQYMLSLDLIRGSSFTRSGVLQQEYHVTYGGPPWTHREQWLAEAPDFNLQQIRVPVRIDGGADRPSLLWEWEFYAGLRYLGVPTDLTYYPQGEHDMTRPEDRATSTESSLDWLDYWINGHEDSSARKAAQYARWQEMREAWNARDRGECATCRPERQGSPD